MEFIFPLSYPIFYLIFTSPLNFISPPRTLTTPFFMVHSGSRKLFTLLDVEVDKGLSTPTKKNS